MTRARKPTMPKARLRWTGGDDRPKRPMHSRCCVRHTGAGGTLRFHLSDADLRRWLRKARRVWASPISHDGQWDAGMALARDVARTLDPEGWRKG